MYCVALGIQWTLPPLSGGVEAGMRRCLALSLIILTYLMCINHYGVLCGVVMLHCVKPLKSYTVKRQILIRHGFGYNWLFDALRLGAVGCIV